MEEQVKQPCGVRGEAAADVLQHAGSKETKDVPEGWNDEECIDLE